ncbi:MAG: helicase-exonuclease AddAB subunit AddA [Oscillospiraceae bacterium]|nr:helicase-exonuclease AddAB subunit AddA [Oscillospiraceae bacterium]
MKNTFTPAQRAAIESRGGAVLVSAAAGSGKTSVLTERLIRRVEEGEDIDRFLVITYTRAAAAELRERIMAALGRRAAEEPEDKRLRRQQTLCCRAHIGTIHSFCSTLLRENCHHLGLSPAFTVIDEERADAIKSAVLSRLLDRRYEMIEHDPDFRLLADTVGAGRDDQRLEKTVLALFEKLRSQPYPEDWAAAQKAELERQDVTDVGQTIWGQELLSALRSEAADWASAMDGAVQEIAAAGGAIAKAYGPSFSETADALRELVRTVSRGWDAARDACKAVPFTRLGGLRGWDDAALKSRVTAVRAGCKKAIEGFSAGAFSADSARLLRDLRAAAPAMCALLDLTGAFSAAFQAEKNRRGYLDFSDLEHYAAQLLVDKASGAPTWIAVETGQRFAEIMVDEYQDASPVQEMIFRALSDGERKLFLVGDVKQSIYRFRLADPALFLEKYRRYAPAETAAEGAPKRILLQENFRSRRPVLEAANQVFSTIMSETLGEMDYGADAALRYGTAFYPEGGDAPVELAILDAGASDGEEEAPEKAELEARYVARRILELMRAGAPVTTPDGARRCDWNDFVILLRAPGARGAVFHRVLAEAGIPVQSRQSGGFFTSLEVTVAVNLLSLIDNPHADVPLISVLRSPVFGFDVDALSAVRAGCRDGSYYDAVRAAAADGDEKCAAFLRLLDTWRALAPDLPLDRLLWRVCVDTDLFAVCAAMRDGDARRANLTRLFTYAQGFTADGRQGVFRFVRYLQTLAEKGAEPPCDSGGNAVRILSVHRSKGLEFPFVFLCDLSHLFNHSDARECVLMHSALGLGPKFMDSAHGVEYPTVAHRAIERRLAAEMLSEEMRVLYVAMTRAKERLVMTCTWKNAAATLKKVQNGAPPLPAILRAAPSPDRWIAQAAPPGGAIRVEIIDNVAAPEAEPAPAETETAGAEEAAYAELCETLRFVYPHVAAVVLPSKLTATELKGVLPAAQPDGDAAGLLPPEPEAAETPFRRVELGRPRPLNAAERGTATHSFLQYLDFSQTETRAQLEAELRRLSATGRLDADAAAAVDLHTVQRLFASPLGRSMRGASELRREFRFTLLSPAADYFPGAEADETLLLQGMVDCFFVENGAITIVDYKTDRVTAAEAPARARRYQSQLRAYANALRRILHLPVCRCVLWFLHPAVAEDVPVDAEGTS